MLLTRVGRREKEQVWVKKELYFVHIKSQISIQPIIHSLIHSAPLEWPSVLDSKCLHSGPQGKRARVPDL